MKAPEVEGVEGSRHELELMPGDQYVVCMAFSPDGNLLLTISANEDHTIRIWCVHECAVATTTATPLPPLMATHPCNAHLWDQSHVLLPPPPPPPPPPLLLQGLEDKENDRER